MAWLGMAWQGAVVRRAEEMVARMQVQLAAMEKEAAHKDTVLDRLLAHAKSTKQQMRAVEERSRVEKDELRREMTEQQQRMQKLELETAAGREERMRRQLMEAQEGIAHRDAFLQQLQEEASPPLRSNRLPGRCVRTLPVSPPCLHCTALHCCSFCIGIACHRSSFRHVPFLHAFHVASSSSATPHLLPLSLPHPPFSAVMWWWRGRSQELAEVRMAVEEMAGRVGRLESEVERGASKVVSVHADFMWREL
ncbi:unnamed protein product [Closterium sp. NIES-54]